MHYVCKQRQEKLSKGCLLKYETKFVWNKLVLFILISRFILAYICALFFTPSLLSVDKHIHARQDYGTTYVHSRSSTIFRSDRTQIQVV
jgi:hypothetical protein